MPFCRKCKSEKPLKEFNKKSKGRQSHCRSCQREHFRIYYRQTPGIRTKHIARTAARNRRVTEENRRLIDSFKTGPCLDCHKRYKPWQMDFDHVRGVKKFNIAELVSRGGSEAQLLDELAKCELVCSNCHRDRTHNRAVAQACAQM